MQNSSVLFPARNQPLVLKEGLGWLFTGYCAFIFCASSVFAQNRIKPNRNNPQSAPTPLTMDSCQLLWNTAYSFDRNWKWQQAYDTGRKVIETCPNYSETYRAFDFTDDGIEQMNSSDTSRFRKYRNWLISVLFLNRSQDYFCRCMKSIANTYQYSEHTRFPNAGSSIFKWMHDHKYCNWMQWQQWDSEGISANYFGWVDMGNSPSTFDSFHYTMKEIGLGFLDSLKAGVEPQKPVSSIYLSSFSIAPNPSQGAIKLNYTLARQGFVQFTIYDQLGRLAWNRTGESEEAGIYEVPVDLRNSPSGTYYVRIEAGFGEVQTVKIVLEK